MQNTKGSNPVIELSIVLPVLGKGIFLDGMLKLLTIDLNVAHEIIIVALLEDIDAASRLRISSKYTNIRWLEKSSNDGTLGALRQGVKASLGEYILVICADNAGPIIAINQMLKLAHEGCTFVSGTRYAAGGRRLGGSFLLMALSKIANGLLHSLGGSAFTDCTTGLKLFHKDTFQQLSLESTSDGWVIAFEMALKAQLAGLSVGEVANVAIDRLYGGDSTGHIRREFFQYLKWFFWGLAKLPHFSKANPPIKSLGLTD